MRMDPGEETSELAVETLLAELALTRLGTLLQGARQQHSSSRRDVASKVGTTARELRRYETGAAPVPPGIVNALAEFYGADLGVDLSRHGALPIEAPGVAALDAAHGSTGDADEVLRAYVGILGRERQRTPEAPVTLRADDIAVLSATLAVEPQYVKGRIAELLTFTAGLRRKTRLRRRKRVLSGAGIAILLATAVGFGIGALVGAAPSRADQSTPTVAASSSTTTAPSTTVARSSTTPPLASTTVAPPASLVPPPAVIAPPPVTDPTTTTLSIGTAVTVVETTTTVSSTTTTAATTTTTFRRPVISTDTTPISIPGTEPVTIITSP